jgi:hypothetical protein
MKKTLALLFLVLTFVYTSNATTYYVSSSQGNDANNGTSPSSPWQSIYKLNSMFNNLSSGDQVLFNRGDYFYGTILPTQGFASGNPLVFGAYGSGANPVITGFVTVNSWNNLGGNIWESSSAVSTLNDMNMVVINGVNTPMGRYPNTGWMNVDSHTTGATSVTSSSLGAINWTGADMVMKTHNYATQRNLITSQSGSTIYYNAITPDNATNGFGFFIENDPRTLDIQNEWYYNPSTKKIRIYSVASPTNVQVSTLDTLVYFVGKNNMTFNGIDFTGSNRRAFYVCSSSNITIQNCGFYFHGLYAIWGNNNYGSSAANFNFTGNVVREVNSKAIDLGNEYVNPYFGYNIFKNIGTHYGMFKLPTANTVFDGAYAVIFCNDGVNGLVAEYNSIDSTGHNGIMYTNQTNARINNNEISNHCLLEMDGGGIYTYSDVVANGKIYNNIVHDGYGDNSGTNDPNEHLAEGIYLDGGIDRNTSNVEVYNNTCFNNAVAGIFSNSNINCNFHNNTCYNNSWAQMLCTSTDLSTPVSTETNNIVQNNIFVARTESQAAAEFDTKLSTFDFFSLCDYNCWARPIDDNVTFNNSLNEYTTFDHYTLAQWQQTSGFDAHSFKSPKAITDLNDLIFEYNASASNITIPLGGTYIDVKNASYNGSITLAPYTSAVLIRTGAATNQPPVANAGPNQTITLPINSVSFSGSGTDASGTITSYNWSQIGGPSAPTISGSNSAVSSVSGLLAGTYIFQLTVSDNNGASATDQITVNVLPANVNSTPVANAGPDQTITAPASSVILAGSSTDEGGTITSYNWSQISGPNAPLINGPGNASASASGLMVGTYVFQLTVSDNNGSSAIDQMTVNVLAANSISTPVANAGPDQSIIAPTSSVTLSGSGTDVNGTITLYNWSLISGPNTPSINGPHNASTSASGLLVGTYVFQLTVSDNNGAWAIDQMTVNVLPTNSISTPVANAGPDQSVNGPASPVTLSGSGTDVNGTITLYNWSLISGPNSPSINSPHGTSTSISGLMVGTYVFQLTVSDNNGAWAIDQVTVNVLPPASISMPVAFAGTSQIITYPKNSVTLSGWGTDINGTITLYNWSLINGPTNPTINGTHDTAASVTGLMVGTYVFQLTVSDDNGAWATDQTTVTVLPASSLSTPVVNAGPNQTITLPANAVTLSGSGTDINGTITSYYWSLINGPSGPPISGNSNSSASVSGLLAGIYVFQLTVVDNNGAWAVDQVTINVLPAGQGLSSSMSSSDIISNQVPLAAPLGLNVYPNPFVSNINVTITGAVAGNYQLKLFDASGKLVLLNSGTKASGNAIQTLNASSLPNGIYFLTVVQNNTSAVIKLVK